MKKIFLGLLVMVRLIANGQSVIKLTQLEKSGIAYSLLKTNGSSVCGFLPPGTNGQLLGIVAGAPAWTNASSILTGYVPYTGATSDLNTGSHNILTNQLNIASIPHYSSASNAFLVGDAGTVEYRTAANVLSDIGGVATSRTLTINGTTYDLSANRSWSVGDLLSTGSYSNPSWLTGLAWSKITGAPSFISLTSLSATNATASGGGSLAYNNSTGVLTFTPPSLSSYLTANQTITLSGAVTGSGTTSITTTLANSIVGIANLSATGSASSSTYLRGDNTWATIGTTGWGTTGNSGTSYTTNFLGTTDNVSLRIKTNNTARIIIDSIGRVGINTAKPIVSSQLDVQGASGGGGLVVCGNNVSSVTSAMAGTGKLLVGWNRTAGNGEVDIISNRGSSTGGGTYFYDVDNANNVTIMCSMQPGGYLGVNTASPASNLTVNGSLAGNIVTKTANYTLGSSDFTVIFNGSSLTATLPAASGCTGRIYQIVNINASSLTTSTYLNYSNSSITSISANSAIRIQSNGTSWYLIP